MKKICCVNDMPGVGKIALSNAMQVVRDIIKDNLDKKEKFFGVDIERYISEGKL